MKTIMKKSIKSLMALAVAFMGISTAVNADVLKRDTVYMIPSMEGVYDVSFPISAYKVENDGNLTHVKTVDVNTTRYSAVGLAVCTKNKRIFVSHEGYDTVEVLDGETFERLDDLPIPGTNDIAGMVFSEDRGRLYVVDRGNPHIFVYTVDSNGDVVRVPGEEFDADYGVYGVDVWNNRLYCTHGHSSNSITIYDLDTEAIVDSYVPIDSRSMAIAVDGSDSSNVLVYTTWTNQGTTSSRLTQYNVNTDVERRIDLQRDGRGLSVNPALGLVYAVTGDSGDASAPELRTYREDQFTTDATPPTPTPWDTEPLIQGRNPTDVFAAGITFNPQATIEMIDPADQNLTAGKDVIFKITIQNPSSVFNMTVHDMEDLYITDDISFISSSLTPDDSVDDGNISWSGIDITIAPDANYTFTKTFETLREVNCSAETIQVTRATYATDDGTKDVEPYGNTLYFDVGPSVGCDPELKKRDNGSALGMLSALMLAMFTLLFGSLAMRRKSTDI